jgi:hypothetical protein
VIDPAELARLHEIAGKAPGRLNIVESISQLNAQSDFEREFTPWVVLSLLDALEKARREIAEYRAFDQAKRELFAEAIGHYDPQSVTEHTTIEDLYHKAGKLMRAELEADRDSVRALLHETLGYIHDEAKITARIKAELEK